MGKKSNENVNVPFNPSARTRRNSQTIAVSLIYIIMGISSFLNVFDALKALFSGDTSGASSTILTAVIALLMVLAGGFALFKTQRKIRVWIGILIFIAALVSFVLSFISFSGLQTLSTALMQCAISWLFILSE